MVRYCSVPGCKSYATDKGISFHRYPTDPILRRKWIDALKVGLFQSPSASVCSRHFKRDAFREPAPYLLKGVWGKRGTLKPLAVPSENLPRHGWNLRSRKKKMVKPPKATDGRTPRPCVRLKLSRRIQVDFRKPTRTKATFHFVWCHSKGTQTEEMCLVDETSKEQRFRATASYVVTDSCLLKLFRKCRTCLAPCDKEVALRGTKLIRITATCRSGHVASWAS
uniref:Putative dna transposase thap9 n=1 Tax=Ixodes ricinus TaxID=34613 RepID=A0A147BDP8_IXORI